MFLANHYNNHLSTYWLDLLDCSKMSLPITVSRYSMASGNVSWIAEEGSERKATVVVSDLAKCQGTLVRSGFHLQFPR